jgi:hypothetical protein
MWQTGHVSSAYSFPWAIAPLPCIQTPRGLHFACISHIAIPMLLKTPISRYFAEDLVEATEIWIVVCSLVSTWSQFQCVTILPGYYATESTARLLPNRNIGSVSCRPRYNFRTWQWQPVRQCTDLGQRCTCRWSLFAVYLALTLWSPAVLMEENVITASM